MGAALKDGQDILTWPDSEWIFPRLQVSNLLLIHPGRGNILVAEYTHNLLYNYVGLSWTPVEPPSPEGKV